MAELNGELLAGWVARALDLLMEVDEYQQTEEWRRDVEALRQRFYNITKN
jgi:hypothetical protein